MTPDEKRCATCWGECGKCVLEREKPALDNDTRTATDHPAPASTLLESNLNHAQSYLPKSSPANTGQDFTPKQLCAWLRDHSAGAYRPSAEAADLIERLLAAQSAPATGGELDVEAERREFEAAVDEAYPITDSPHTSVQQRTADSRIAFRFGWEARAARSAAQGAAPQPALAALKPFAEAYAPEAARMAKFYTPDDIAKYGARMDANTITPSVTMGDFRRAHEAYFGRAPSNNSPVGAKEQDNG